MKEFDYEKAKAGAAVCTRDGKPARIVCWDALGGDLSILALVLDIDHLGNEEELAYWYTKDGKSDDECEADLMMAPVHREGWLYLYNKDGHMCSSIYIYKTAKDAEKAACELWSKRHCRVVKIEWEE